MTRQLRRASASIGYNIAEGCGRDTDADFALSANRDGFSIRKSSTNCGWRRTWYLSVASHDRLAEQAIEVRKMLRAFIDRLRHRS
ncbi:MAG: four helix bundle protein [Dehalococcoidia bacterium]|nr:four helix bundle protein [Dehalococcoidia bacterium]